MKENKYIQLFEKYLNNESSEQESQLIGELFRNDGKIQSVFENKLRNADPVMDEEISNLLFQRIRSSISSKKPPLSSYSPRKKTLRWAAIFLLPVISVLSVYFIAIRNPEKNASPIIVTTDSGEKAKITLADGSGVWLNSGSSISYPVSFNRKERTVFLTGEAYFEVVNNTKHPFTVKTKEMDIQALGTAFDVCAYESESVFSSVLLEGKVKVTTHGKESILEKNERATYDKINRTLLIDKVYAPNHIEWKNGKLYFQNQSFDEIANTLSRVFKVDFSFISDELRPLRFSGTLSSSSIRTTLDILSLTSPMQYEMNGTSIELHYRE